MRRLLNHLLIFTVLVGSAGCATMSNRTKTILSMIGVGFVAGTIAANMAPQNDNPSAHGLMWGASAAVVTGAASLYIYDDEGKKKEAERKLEITQNELSQLKDESDENPSKLYESTSALESKLPPEYQGLIEPGKYQIYKVNHWVSQGDNVLIHEDKMVRMVPPQLKPKQAVVGQNQ